MRTLPLFPLNTVLFPGMPIYLHIFEPRYRLMMKNLLAGDRTFGVVLIRQGVEAFGPPAEPFLQGCSARIDRIETLQDGRSNLVAIGEERFTIRQFDMNEPYLNGMVECAPMERPQSIESHRGMRRMTPVLQRYLKMMHDSGNVDLDLANISFPEDPLYFLYMAAALLQIPPREKQPLLESTSADHLLHQLERLYRRETALLERSAQGEPEPQPWRAWMN